MKKLSRINKGLKDKFPIKVVQFGEGNFLRAFVDFAFQRLNDELGYNAGIAIVQPIDMGLVDMLNQQDGLYTLFSKGMEKGQEIEKKELISNIVKGINPYQSFDEFKNLALEESLAFIISNTTESGIAYVKADTFDMRPPSSFPAKLTLLLHERYKHFNGNVDKGLTIIPCELINHNSDMLKTIILKYIDDWKLGNEFKDWILNHNGFHNTLVDRIVPGYPKDEIEEYNKQLDYEDKLMVVAETFFLWIIEGDRALREKLPFHNIDLNVKIVKDMQPYRTRKVRILNGAHTSLFPISILNGNTTVKESIDNMFTGNFIKKLVFDEIIETVDMDKEELTKFAEEVFDRFRNPFIKHQLSSLALNSISKFKVRVLPSLLEYIAVHNKIPTYLTYAFACLIQFYKGSWQGRTLPINDENDIVQYFKKIWELKDYRLLTAKALNNTDFWSQDLTQVHLLPQAIEMALREIDSNGIENGFVNFHKCHEPLVKH